MQTQRVNITIPYPILRVIHENVPSGKRSKFIAEAVLEKLGKAKSTNQQLRKSLKENKEFYNQVGKDWSATEFETWPR